MTAEYKDQRAVPVPESYEAELTSASQSLPNEMQMFTEELSNMRNVYMTWLESLLNEV
ncbi:hypothetical protein AZE42_14164 [Rhizopogon vesiculosus]|uniref:Uncharacterized protein n=1 Tax=Rhizopogon vesiculosus TaxID=180088 RepID=A0A1J8PYT6_9AGAM|nr:hypothetical protein AZE42_14164 [Rhizopogon vesiculosus]